LTIGYGIGLVLAKRTATVKALKVRGSKTSEYRMQEGFIGQAITDEGRVKEGSWGVP
jgi:hypothetical protein